MKRAKKKKDDIRKKYVISDKQVKKLKDEVTKSVMEKSMILHMVTLADTYHWDEDQIVEFFENVSRNTRYIEQKTVTIREVEQIIEKHTGIVIRW